MRVAMVMPMAPESAIADVMLQAVPALFEEWDLDIWCPTEDAYLNGPVRVRPYAQPHQAVLDELSYYDLVVYVLGDSPWHARILPLALRLPGLVVLHDASLTNLVRTSAIEQDEMAALVAHVESVYGPSAAATIRTAQVENGRDGWLRFCAEVPLGEYVVGRSLGAVVHSQWHARSVDGYLLGDVTVAPLPVPSVRTHFAAGPSTARPLLDSLPDDAVLLVTLGTVNANRGIDTLLEAIASDALLTEKVHLWAVGSVEDNTRLDLSRTARSLGLQDRFRTVGRVGDASLEAILQRADVAAALRDPVLEGQSASVLTQLLSGIPVLVLDHAHYSELPDDVVLKISPSDRVTGIRDALRMLVERPEERAALGERGRSYVLSTRTGDAYAEGLLDAGRRALAARPAVHLVEDVGARLRRLDLADRPAVAERVTALAFDLFDLA